MVWFEVCPRNKRPRSSSTFVTTGWVLGQVLTFRFQRRDGPDPPRYSLNVGICEIQTSTSVFLSPEHRVTHPYSHCEKTKM